jgi:hypothetical protein
MFNQNVNKILCMGRHQGSTKRQRERENEEVEVERTCSASRIDYGPSSINTAILLSQMQRKSANMDIRVSTGRTR